MYEKYEMGKFWNDGEDASKNQVQKSQGVKTVEENIEKAIKEFPIVQEKDAKEQRKLVYKHAGRAGKT